MEKIAQKAEMEQELERKKLEEEEQKKKQQMLEMKEMELKRKEKEEQRLRQIEEKQAKKRLSQLGVVGTGIDTGLVEERKQTEEQQQTKELMRSISEEKDQRKNKAFERKMQKEQKKKEKEERKLRVAEEMKAKKNMEVHLEEQLIKEKLSGGVERTDPFVAFDSIDQETAVLLSRYGYTSVEKLREATVKDLVKIGVKKKNAQMILAECGEFVEWEVLDVDEYPVKI
jgi:hypothetical protein